jgi:quinoprotein glucose dehydrogenase
MESTMAAAPINQSILMPPRSPKENVNQMQVAWVYPTMDSVFNFFQPHCCGYYYVCDGEKLLLLLLSMLEQVKKSGFMPTCRTNPQRELTIGKAKTRRTKRLLFTLNNTLQAIDALTGKSITTFGKNGYVDMREGLDRPVSSIRRMQSMMPGVIFEDLIIMGSAPGEGYFSPPGYIRAYNVVTGKRVWTFHTIPHPGEYGL